MADDVPTAPEQNDSTGDPKALESKSPNKIRAAQCVFHSIFGNWNSIAVSALLGAVGRNFPKGPTGILLGCHS